MADNRPIGPFLYLPIEVASRELHAKLLLAYFAVARGYEVVIGWKRMINKNLRYMPPGLVIFKTLTANDGEAMAKARAAGHRVAAIDEEVPGLVATKQKLRWVAPESVAASDLVFAAGEEHLEALRQFHPGYADRYPVVGNPRWDLLRPELRGSHDADVAEIRRQYAPFILINTNFATLNSSRRTAEETRAWFVETRRVDLGKPGDVVFLDEIFEMERANTAAIRDLVRALPARFPQHRIIVRPHPIERAESWTEFLRGVPRAEMIREGAAVPWIMASDVLVHTNCTTGVEAFALDKPAISLQPIPLSIYEIYLSNRINYLTHTVAEALAQLDRLIGPGASWTGYPAEYRQTFDRFFAGMHGPFACEHILDAVGERFGLRLTPHPRSPAWRPVAGYMRRTRTRKHHAAVMPEIDAASVEQVLRGFDRAFGTDRPVQVEPCGQIVFHLHGAATRAAHDLPGDVSAWLQRLWPRSRSASAAEQSHLSPKQILS
jgi:surface carbohydrate biosynthesis protein